MNERIEKLWNKAKQSHADEVTDGDLSKLNLESPFVQIDIHKKFAELIVKECVETLGTHEDYWTHEQSMAELKKHFGVEE